MTTITQIRSPGKKEVKGLTIRQRKWKEFAENESEKRTISFGKFQKKSETSEVALKKNKIIILSNPFGWLVKKKIIIYYFQLGISAMTMLT